MSDRSSAASSTTTTITPAIALQQVVKRFGDRLVLDHVDLTVETGQLVALGGRSGVGKSTLIQLIAALDSPDSGRIEVCGQVVGNHHRQSQFRRTGIGIVFQLHNLVPRLTAQQNVELALFGSGLSRHQRSDRACELLADVGLEDFARDRPPTMSGGERQRVAIARALANRPPVILADEPTGNLDDESAVLVLNLFRKLVDGSVTVFAASHDERLDRLADRRLVLADGTIHDDS